MSAKPDRIGKYHILRELGRGGMGVVYRALDPLIERPVALKTIVKSQLDPADAPTLLRRFKREAQAAGRLLHPNIVSVYEYGEEREYAYIAMELVEGRGLNEYLTRGTPLPVDRVRSLVAQILSAIHYAHTQGVVHRDIKPANLIMTRDWRVKVSDFGIAQLDSTRLTQLGTVLGTPSYMSPEQFNGAPTDQRADIFSAGVAVYELLTGRKPFNGSNIGALAQAVLTASPLPPSEINPVLDSALDAVLLRALAVTPSDRFASADDFARALDAAFDGRRWEGAVDVDATVPITDLPPATSALQPAPTPTPGSRIDFTAITRKLTVPGVPAVVGIALPRVLFVDDEERILSALKLLFRQTYEVHVTTDPAQALAWLKQQHFHVVVSDQRMPNISGTELLSKAKLASPNTVRILLTGYSDLAAIIGSINEGEVYRFANKPWNSTEIRALLADAVAIGVALEDAPAATVGRAKPTAAVLIVDDDREVYLAARDLFGDRYRLLHAIDLVAALDVLRDQAVAVLVADIDGMQENSRTLFRILKREHPQILTIAMSAASDSDLVIELINQAQIFRFLNKPLKLPMLQQHVTAAMAQFHTAQPKRPPSPRHARPVRVIDKPVEESSLAGLIVATLRAFRARLYGR